MNHVAVKSTNIASIGYDYSLLNMEVKFKGGALYRYDNVPPEVHAKFLNASSPDSHFAAHIKPYFSGSKING